MGKLLHLSPDDENELFSHRTQAELIAILIETLYSFRDIYVKDFEQAKDLLYEYSEGIRLLYQGLMLPADELEN